MFNLFKKDKVELIIYAPVSGLLKPITEVSDDMFSQKILGDGYVIYPSENKIYAPVSGKVSSVFPTKHAINFISDEGVEILLHLGLDTVELKGEPFDISVKEGEKVNTGTVIGTMDRENIVQKGKSDEVIILVPNNDKVNEVVEATSIEVEHGDNVGKVILK